MTAPLQTIGIRGRCHLLIITPDPDAGYVSGMDLEADWAKTPEGLWAATYGRDNAFLTQGLSKMLDGFLASVTTPTWRIGVSSSTTAVTAASTTFGGTARFAAMNATFPTHTAGTATCSFQSDFTKGSGAGQIDFVVTKMGVTIAAADTAGAVVDIIGGTGGSSPYNEPISVDYTSATSFTYRPQIDVTLSAI